jgi:hypothetical protein
MGMTELQRLRDRVEQLEEVLGINPTMACRLHMAFSLETQLAEILGMLLSREFVTRGGLYAVLYGDLPESQWPQEKTLDARLFHLRKALQPHGISIITRWGHGWYMRQEDKTKVRAALDRVQRACDAAASADVPQMAAG